MITYNLQGPKSQEVSYQRIHAALKENRFPQAILIDGPEGIGKKKLALLVMQALVCTHPETRPCNKCFQCKAALSKEASHNWLIPLTTSEANTKTADELGKDSKAETQESITSSYIQKILENPFDINYLASGATISVNLMRNFNSRFTLKGNSVRCVIIPEAERMNQAAANAFLKTLEEVPENTYFILTAASRDLLLDTIRSRCSALRLETLTESEVQEEVFSKLDYHVSEDALGYSMGSPGRAMFFDEQQKEISPLAKDFVINAFKKDYSDFLFEIEEYFPKTSGQNEKKKNEILGKALLFLDVLSFILSDVTRIQNNIIPRMPNIQKEIPRDILENLSPEIIQNALLKIQNTAKNISGKSTSPRMALQTLVIKLFDEGSK